MAKLAMVLALIGGNLSEGSEMNSFYRLFMPSTV